MKSNANAINLETGDTLLKNKSNNTTNNAPLSRSASTSEINEQLWDHVNYHHRSEFAAEDAKENEFQYPTCFRTAVAVRTSRLSNQFNGKKVLSPVYDASTDQESSVPSTPIKEKKVNGIRKIVKKFF